MRKMIILLLVLCLLALPCMARSQRTIPAVGSVEGTILHTIQTAWVIAETENSGDTEADVLSDTERTKAIVDRLIAANSNNDGQMSLFILPAEWNVVQFRGIGITNNLALTHQIYFGTVIGQGDCEFSHVGQLAWTIGLQTSIYDQIAFTSGGPYEPKPGNIVTGNDSSKTAVVVSKTLTGGTWAGGDAVGVITYRSASGSFTSGEKISIVNPRGVTQADVLTHAASDLIDFELADTLTVTSKSWGSSWSSFSPANDTNAEAEIDKKGANLMLVVTTTCAADGKLLITGY